jgi:hypothetical protein
MLAIDDKIMEEFSVPKEKISGFRIQTNGWNEKCRFLTWGTYFIPNFWLPQNFIAIQNINQIDFFPEIQPADRGRRDHLPHSSLQTVFLYNFLCIRRKLH